MKKVIYTCIVNNYDTLLDVEQPEYDIDYICFTDSEIASKTWKIIKIKNNLDLDCSRFSKHPKIMPHLFLKEYDASIWIDGNIRILGNINEIFNSVNDTNFHICKHPSRSCLYKEAQIVSGYKLDNKEIIERQIKKYREEGFPENFGLISGGVIVRDHDDNECIKIMEQWWNEILSFSKRDQLSFNYVAWKNNFKFEYLKFDFRTFILKSKFFEYVRHSSK